MRIFVDELPKDCIDCPCESDYYCNLLNEDVGCCEWGEIHKNCPLQSLADYTKQVRKEVLADVEKRIINYCRRQNKKPFQKSIEQIKSDLLTSINQIQGDNVE